MNWPTMPLNVYNATICTVHGLYVTIDWLVYDAMDCMTAMLFIVYNQYMCIVLIIDTIYCTDAN